MKKFVALIALLIVGVAMHVQTAAKSGHKRGRGHSHARARSGAHVRGTGGRIRYWGGRPYRYYGGNRPGLRRPIARPIVRRRVGAY